MKTTGLLAAGARLLRSGILLLSFGLGLSPGGPAAAQQPAHEAEPAHAARTFAQLQATIAALPDTSRIGQLREFVDVMLEAGQPAQAQLAAQEAVRVAEALGDNLWLSRSLGSLGYTDAMRADYPAAIQHYLRASDLAQKTTAYHQQTRMLLRLGNAYEEAKEWTKAEAYLQQSLAVARQHQLVQDEAYAYNSLAALADMRKQPDLALQYGQQARAAYQAIKDWSGYYSALLNLGIMYKNRGRYAESEQTYREALRYAQAQHDQYLEGYVNVNLPTTLLLLGRPAEAEQVLQRGLAWSQHVPERVGIRRDLFETLTRIKEAQHDYQAALRYHRIAAAYQDTLLNQDKNRQLVEAETRYKTAQQHARITQLDAQNTQRLRLLWGLGVGLAGLLGFLGLTAWQSRIIRRKNAELEITNHTITDNSQRLAEQSRRLTLLIRELHHRVKNNLAIISSLLRLQSDRLQDERAARAVREGQQRVEAMSLIHQRLYQTENVTTVDMQLYITDLAQSLMTAYGYTRQTFNLTIEVTQPVLDVDVAVPLGLILNELLTNSFKYAYDDHAAPALCIRLTGGSPANLALEVQDNGPGIDPAQWQRPGGSFGKRLIASLSEQVGGHMKIDGQHGTRYQLTIPAQVALPTA